MALEQCMVCDGQGCSTHQVVHGHPGMLADDPLRGLPKGWVVLRVAEGGPERDYLVFCPRCFRSGLPEV